MTARFFFAAVACSLAALPDIAASQLRSIHGTYRNPALGYSIQIPQGLHGEAGDEAGPERGLRIQLLSGGVIRVFGEPNSLGWKTPGEGLKWNSTAYDCDSAAPQISRARLGRLRGAKARLACGNRIFKSILAFRPGGGPIYWVQLETTRSHEFEDDAVLTRLCSTFHIIRWE